MEWLCSWILFLEASSFLYAPFASVPYSSFHRSFFLLFCPLFIPFQFPCSITLSLHPCPACLSHLHAYLFLSPFPQVPFVLSLPAFLSLLCLYVFPFPDHSTSFLPPTSLRFSVPSLNPLRLLPFCLVTYSFPTYTLTLLTRLLFLPTFHPLTSSLYVSFIPRIHLLL